MLIFFVEGFIIDTTGNYNLPFVVFGVLTIPPGIAFAFLTCLFPELKASATAKVSKVDPSGGVPSKMTPKQRRLQALQNDDVIFASSSSLNITSQS